MLYVGSEPEYQLMHNTQGAVRPRRTSTDVAQSILQFTGTLQLTCGVGSSDSTAMSDSCIVTRERMRLHWAAAAALCLRARGS